MNYMLVIHLKCHEIIKYILNMCYMTIYQNRVIHELLVSLPVKYQVNFGNYLSDNRQGFLTVYAFSYRNIRNFNNIHKPPKILIHLAGFRGLRCQRTVKTSTLAAIGKHSQLEVNPTPNREPVEVLQVTHHMLSTTNSKDIGETGASWRRGKSLFSL